MARFPKLEPTEYDFSYSEHSDSDSIAELASNSDDERFEDPARFIDPHAVLEELISRNAAEEEKLTQNSEAEGKQSSEGLWNHVGLVLPGSVSDLNMMERAETRSFQVQLWFFVLGGGVSLIVCFPLSEVKVGSPVMQNVRVKKYPYDYRKVNFLQ